MKLTTGLRSENSWVFVFNSLLYAHAAHCEGEALWCLIKAFLLWKTMCRLESTKSAVRLWVAFFFFFRSAAADNSYRSINSSRTFLLFRLAKQLFGYAILGFVLTEAIASFALMMAFLISFVFWSKKEGWTFILTTIFLKQIVHSADSIDTVKANSCFHSIFITKMYHISRSVY